MRRRHFAMLGVAGPVFALGAGATPEQSPPNLPRIGWLWEGRSGGTSG